MRALLILVLGTALVAWTVPPAVAAPPGALAVAGPVPTTLTVTSAPSAADDTAPVTVRLLDGAGAPLAGVPVAVERLSGGAWTPVASVLTDPGGGAVVGVPVSREPSDNRVRATYGGDATYAPAAAEHDLQLVPRRTRVRLLAPRSHLDEREVAFGVEWSTASGVPVPGEVLLQRRLVRRPGERLSAKQRRQRSRARWTRVARVPVDAEGRGELVLTPRATYRWRVVAPALPWAEGARSRVRTTRNLPPGRPVRLPAGAPRPRVALPPQRHAVGEGANPVVLPLSDRVWSSMVGRSWHSGCPVGRSGLRLVQVNYWDYDGYRRRGEMVVDAAVTHRFTSVFTEMHARRVPVRAMYRVDRFGWSARLGGADDYASMAAGNTSVFNCRGVVGNPRVRSPHSWGRSLDLNPWENPYRSRHGLVPNSYWQSRTHPRYAWRSGGHPVVAMMRRHGFRWTYGTSDNHHFDALGGGARVPARLLARLADPRCDGPCK